MKALLASLFPRFVLRFAGRLRFPHLFLLAAALFLVDLLLPDLIPFLDEILLGLATLILAALRNSDEVVATSSADTREPISGKAVRIE